MRVTTARAIPPCVRPARPLAAVRSDRRAFTLIELLVVVAIIALLISILVPNLGKARENARAVICGQTERQFANGLAIYFSENSDYIPGLNTSGVALRAKKNVMSDLTTINNPRIPLQLTDWISPIIAGTQELPGTRIARFKVILDRFRCASQRLTSAIYAGSDAQVPEGVTAFTQAGPWPAVSYMMSTYFQCVGQQQAGTYLGELEGSPQKIVATAAQANWEVVVNDYWPRLGNVGPPARKVFVADGTRYVPAGSLPLDHDVSPIPRQYPQLGSFTDSSPWWEGSTAYGVSGESGSQTWDGLTVGRGSPSNGANLGVSYRHGGSPPPASGRAQDNRGQINAVFFDGHVERMNDRESRAIHLWYPSGATVNTPAEGMTTAPQNSLVP